MTLLLVVLLSACAPSDANRPARNAGRAQFTRTNDVNSSAVRRGDGKTNAPSVRPDEMVLGRVATVNTSLRFVVMDFPIRRMPAREQRLNVYRNGQKIGEIRVTGPSQDTTIAGDIMAGEAQPGDEVRED